MSERKALGMCVLAFVIGSLIVMSMGCAVGAGVRVDGRGAAAAAGVEIAPQGGRQGGSTLRANVAANAAGYVLVKDSKQTGDILKKTQFYP